jgi:hypothetical protein
MQRGEVSTLATSANSARERVAGSPMPAKADGGRSSLAPPDWASAGGAHRAAAAASAALKVGVIRMVSGPTFRSDNARNRRTFRPAG